MGQGAGPSYRLTVEDRRELIERVRGGQTFEQAASAVGCSTKAIRRLLRRSGGIKPRTETPERSALRLTLAEREEISRGLLAGQSLRAIARTLGRAGHRLWHAKLPRPAVKHVTALGAPSSAPT